MQKLGNKIKMIKGKGLLTKGLFLRLVCQKFF